jgi:hypothetical protein
MVKLHITMLFPTARADFQEGHRFGFQNYNFKNMHAMRTLA